MHVSVCVCAYVRACVLLSTFGVRPSINIRIISLLADTPLAGGYAGNCSLLPQRHLSLQNEPKKAKVWELVNERGSWRLVVRLRATRDFAVAGCGHWDRLALTVVEVATRVIQLNVTKLNGRRVTCSSRQKTISPSIECKGELTTLITKERIKWTKLCCFVFPSLS